MQIFGLKMAKSGVILSLDHFAPRKRNRALIKHFLQGLWFPPTFTLQIAQQFNIFNLVK
jgi:hypothetical protein